MTTSRPGYRIVGPTIEGYSVQQQIGTENYAVFYQDEKKPAYTTCELRKARAFVQRVVLMTTR